MLFDIDLACCRGRMLVSDLEQKIEKAKAEGAVPFFVSATAGTTVLGAFDPINEVADLCSKHQIWFHVDVSYFQLPRTILLLVLELRGCLCTKMNQKSPNCF